MQDYLEAIVLQIILGDISSDSYYVQWYEQIKI